MKIKGKNKNSVSLGGISCGSCFKFEECCYLILAPCALVNYLKGKYIQRLICLNLEHNTLVSFEFNTLVIPLPTAMVSFGD